MKALLLTSLIGAMGILGVTGSAQALSLRGATSISGDLGSQFGSSNAARNKAGLLTSYNNGDDFDAYLLSNPQHTFVSQPGLEYFANQGVTSGNIDFNLGGIFSVSSLLLWNEDSQGIRDFQLFASNTASFSTSTNLGTFVGADNVKDVNYSAQRVNFTTVNAQYIRFAIANAYPDPTTGLISVGVGEVAFGVNDVVTPPVPFEFSPAVGVAALGVVFAAKKFLKAKAAN